MKSETDTPYFPLFFDLTDRRVLFIGAGSIAQRRIETLLPFSARITVIAPELTPRLAQLAAESRILCLKKHFEEQDLISSAEEAPDPSAGCGGLPKPDLVFACTDSREVNSGIVRLCHRLNIPVNNCSDHTQCDFFFPGIVREENTVIGITASGTAHRRVRELRESIAGLLHSANETGSDNSFQGRG